MRVIEAELARRGRAPTIREIGRQVGLASTHHVWYYLKKLEKEGYITRPKVMRMKGRNIRLTKKRMFQ